MTPACSTRFSACDSSVDESVRAFGAAFNSTNYPSSGGISLEFLARHATDRSLVENPHYFQDNDFWNRHTACVVDPALSIPTKRDIAPTHCHWRSVSEPSVVTSSNRTNPVAPGGACGPSSAGATPFTAEAVGGDAEKISAADSQVRSFDACLKSMERKLDEILVCLKISTGAEWAALASPAEESSDSQYFHDAGLENLGCRLDQILSYLRTPIGIEETGPVSPAEESSDRQHFHDASLEEIKNQREGYNGAVEQKSSHPVAEPRLQPATDQSSRHQPKSTRNDSHGLDRAKISLTELRRSLLTAGKKIENNCCPIRQQLSEQKRVEQPQLQRDAQREQVGLPAPETFPFTCEHYQRKCFVQFYCCSDYYPCHRCHNDHSKCGNTGLKALHAIRLKCANCLVEQDIDENSQRCSSCNLKLSEYFCAICKHFTRTDHNPYHCDKCGICRIDKGNSFHCDMCNVCLNIKLKGKHKCRPDSGHETCCICLEDGFSGCQILPCSHKVHRECAVAMIQNGVRSCPVCRNHFVIPPS